MSERTRHQQRELERQRLRLARGTVTASRGEAPGAGPFPDHQHDGGRESQGSVHTPRAAVCPRAGTA